MQWHQHLLTNLTRLLFTDYEVTSPIESDACGVKCSLSVLTDVFPVTVVQPVLAVDV